MKPKQLILVRTYSAGVHVGELVAHKGREVVLKNARRIWNWQGANTLHEVSQKGVAKESRISEPVPTITLTEAIELILCSPEASANLKESRWS